MKDNEHICIFHKINLLVGFKRFRRLRVNFSFCCTKYGLKKKVLPPLMVLLVMLSQLLRKFAEGKLVVGWLQSPHFHGEVCNTDSAYKTLAEVNSWVVNFSIAMKIQLTKNVQYAKNLMLCLKFQSNLVTADSQFQSCHMGTINLLLHFT